MRKNYCFYLYHEWDSCCKLKQSILSPMAQVTDLEPVIRQIDDYGVVVKAMRPTIEYRQASYLYCECKKRLAEAWNFRPTKLKIRKC